MPMEAMSHNRSKTGMKKLLRRMDPALRDEFLKEEKEENDSVEESMGIKNPNADDDDENEYEV